MSNKLLSILLRYRYSIGGKLFIAIAGSSLLITSLSLAFFIPMDLNRMKQINKNDAHVFIKAFDKDFTRVILLNTTEESVNLTEHLRKFPLVQSLTLLNIAGEQIFTYSRAYNNATTQSEFLEMDFDDFQFINKSFGYMGEDYGSIDLVVSNARLNDRIKQYFQLVIPLIVTLVVIAFGVARLLRNYFADPIKDLSSTINAVANTRNYSQQIYSDSKDEIGLLYKGFNELLSTVSDTQTLLAKEKEQAVFTLNSITDAVIRTDQFGNIEYMNPAAVAITGYKNTDNISRPVEDLFSIISANDKKSVANPITQCIFDNRIINENKHHVMIMHNHHGIDVEFSAAPIHNQQNNVVGAVIVFKDVTKAREAARRLSYLASHDNLTGMNNRRVFEKYMQRALESAKNKSHEHVLIFMDLDKFKIINDNLGHLAGDDVLCDVAGILTAKIRDTDIIARFGGDEFGALLIDCNAKQGMRIAQSIRMAIERYRLNWEGKSYSIGISLGLVSITSDSKGISGVLKAADTACYDAKKAGRNRVCVYGEGRNARSNVTKFPTSD